MGESKSFSHHAATTKEKKNDVKLSITFAVHLKVHLKSVQTFVLVMYKNGYEQAKGY